jgi:putative ABC transport system ATP-binding protein
MKIIETNKINKSFGIQHVLKDLSFDVESNEMIAIMGKSGTGKSTILNILGLLDKPDSGDYMLFGFKNIRPFSTKATKMLRDKIGFLFQNYALIDSKDVYYNLNLVLKNRHRINHEEMVAKALETVGLAGFETKKVYQCSGGEQQRIAVARLLLKPCELVLADEPTGSLDIQNRDEVIKLMKILQASGKTVVIVTHDHEVANQCDRIIKL